MREMERNGGVSNTVGYSMSASASTFDGLGPKPTPPHTHRTGVRLLVTKTGFIFRLSSVERKGTCVQKPISTSYARD
jgi:hypothetical protein